MSEKATLLIAVCFIAFAAVANLVRLLWDIAIHIGTFSLPGWTGGVAYLILGMLACWSFRALASLSFSPPSNLSDL